MHVLPQEKKEEESKENEEVFKQERKEAHEQFKQ